MRRPRTTRRRYHQRRDTQSHAARPHRRPGSRSRPCPDNLRAGVKWLVPAISPRDTGDLLLRARADSYRGTGDTL
jgi:hypothetical protein